MKIIYYQRAITIDWLVKAGINNVEEDFTGADIVCVLGGPTDRYHVTATYNSLNRGHISITIPASTLASGVYDARLMWFKTRGGVIRNEQGTKVMQRCDLSYIFAITNISGEDNTGEVISSAHTEHLSSIAEPFGRDGMSAYEIACLRENTTLTESEWIKTYEEAEDRVNYQFDSSHADGWAALFNSDHSRAGTDHSTATTDHSISTSDHNTAVADHNTALADHVNVGEDHTIAVADHTIAVADHATASNDHAIAVADHATASNDHAIAVADHATINNKLDKPAVAGTLGQVLKSNGQGGQVWATGEGNNDFDELINRPKYNGSEMTHETNIPEVKTSSWDGKQNALSASQLAAANSGVTATKVGEYDAHVASEENPHSVTKAQVGLGNVPNTDFTARVETLEGKTKLSDFTDDLGSSPTHTHSQYITEHQSLSEYRKASAQDEIDDGKVDKVAGKGLSTNDYDNTEKGKVASAIQPADLAAVATSGSYDDLTDTPALPTKTSDLTNDSGFITASVADLANYYLKSLTYNKTEVDAIVASIKQFTYELVSALPTASASTMCKIYLVPSSSAATQNVKDEYITIDNGESASTRYTWEQIGSTSNDLSNYVTTAALNAALANYTTTETLTTLLAGKQAVIDSEHKLSADLVDDSSATNKFVSASEKATWSGKQDAISDLSTIRINAASGKSASDALDGHTVAKNVPSDAVFTDTVYDDTELAGRVTTIEGKESGWDGKYSKPSGGIPSTDLSSDVQTSLGKADTALQSHQSLAAYRTSAAQDAIDSEKEASSNKVTSISSSSTDAQYPSAKCVYDIVGEIESIIDTIRGV